MGLSSIAGEITDEATGQRILRVADIIVEGTVTSRQHSYADGWYDVVVVPGHYNLTFIMTGYEPGFLKNVEAVNLGLTFAPIALKEKAPQPPKARRRTSPSRSIWSRLRPASRRPATPSPPRLSPTAMAYRRRTPTLQDAKRALDIIIKKAPQKRRLELQEIKRKGKITIHK